jgi:arylsulfatase
MATLIGCDGDGCGSAKPAVVQSGALGCEDCNVLFFSIDTLRADRLGSYGYARPTSPTLDALAKDGIVFRDVLAQAPTTAPSHRSFFSSTYVPEHGNELKHLPVIASELARHGYATAAFVDSGQLAPAFGLTKGFASYTSTDVERRDVVGTFGGGLEQLNPRVIRWLEGKHDKPFFLFVHTYDVHCPYDPPEPFRSMFVDKAYTPRFDATGRCGKDYYDGLNLGAKEFAHIGAIYDGAIRYTDGKMAEILAALERLGLSDKTLIVVTSDHGESLGERGFVGHNRVYDVQLKVPWIMRLPSRAQRVVHAPVESVDILPTLLSMLGKQAPGTLSGRDLLPRLVDGKWEDNRLRVAHTGSRKMATVHEGKRWSLIVQDDKPPALYDLLADPTEETDLSQRHSDVVRRLMSALARFDPTKREVRELPQGLDEKTLRDLKALGYVQ